MILLDAQHPVLEETLLGRFEAEKHDSLDVRVADFDGASYHFTTPDASQKSKVMMSFSLRCFKELVGLGALDVLKKTYGKYVVDTEPGYDYSLLVDCAAIDNDEKRQILDTFPLLKRNAMAAIFYNAFSATTEKQSSEMMQINYREGEGIYVQAMPDRVTVIFSTLFKEETDRIFAKVFLQQMLRILTVCFYVCQEFVDARRQASCQNAPQVLYTSRDPPLELRNLPNVHTGDNVGYVTFVLFPRHFATDEAREGSITRVLMFRNYLHYHIKCSKAYMHSRMRARVDSFLKIINRAKPEPTGAAAEKKTASGRTFVRRDR
ncbi:Arp complex subunit [Sorochytrium milnesiophthora]